MLVFHRAITDRLPIAIARIRPPPAPYLIKVLSDPRIAPIVASRKYDWLRLIGIWVAAIKWLRLLSFSYWTNVKEHATLSARAHVDHGVKVIATDDHENRVANRGCCVSTCSAFLLVIRIEGKIETNQGKQNCSLNITR